MTVRDLLDTSIVGFDNIWIENISNRGVIYKYTEIDKTANDLLLSSKVISWYTQIRKIDNTKLSEIVITIK